MRLAALLLTPALFAQPARFGVPACPGSGHELSDRQFYLVCHDPVRKVPSWTAHELTPERLMGGAARHRYFRQDTGARNADYRGSGYSRGHMVPAEDLAWSEEAVRSTYALSNVVPQTQSVNAGVWREIEIAVREIAARSDAVYIVTGPIFAGAGDETIGPGQVAVPTHTFKVVLALEGEQKSMYAAIVPNAPLGRRTSPADFTTTVEEVERQTGLDFFSALDPDEQRRLEPVRRQFRD